MGLGAKRVLAKMYSQSTLPKFTFSGLPVLLILMILIIISSEQSTIFSLIGVKRTPFLCMNLCFFHPLHNV